MEIINLKTDPAETCSSTHTITDIKQAVKNENRVNVFVDGKYSFSLDIAQLVDFKIKVNNKVTDDELAEYKKASEFGKLYQRTLEWVLTRPHSVRETRDYLRRKVSNSFRGHPQSRRGRSDEPRNDGSEERPRKDVAGFTSEIIDRLVSRGYLDDRKFAEYYVENRFVKKGISNKRLKMELMKKGIDRAIINDVLDKNLRNDAEEIQKVITKKRNKYDDEKLINYLVRQGFDFELVRNLVRDSSGTDLQN
jgi:regulatory protein